MFYLSALIIFIFDQLTKYYITVALRPNQSLPIIKNVLHLTYVQNRGAAFGLFYGQQKLLVLIGIALMGIILYFHFRVSSSGLMQVLLGFILGGSFGNIFDRIFRNYVVDFIDFRFPYGPYGWPVFNLADTMINLGVFLIILILIFKREGKSSPPDPLSTS